MEDNAAKMGFSVKGAEIEGYQNLNFDTPNIKCLRLSKIEDFLWSQIEDLIDF